PPCRSGYGHGIHRHASSGRALARSGELETFEQAVTCRVQKPPDRSTEASAVRDRLLWRNATGTGGISLRVSPEASSIATSSPSAASSRVLSLWVKSFKR
ncbi:MAG: hypothetical protein AAFY15_13115, partial [Cyanobacteria bacterium J06648_11]